MLLAPYALRRYNRRTLLLCEQRPAPGCSTLDPRCARRSYPMEITHKRFNRVDLLEIEGRMDAASAPQLKQQIEALFDQGRYRLVLDMSKLEYIASPGLRVLIEARKRARDWKLTDL